VSAFVINSYAFGGEDPDAKAYLDAVETADTQALEAAVRKAVDDFVKGCKADGIWSAVKASCILAGARTLAGALTPLVGSAPTNVGGNFVSGDYDRKTGLIGDGSTKYLDSNRNNNADPQDNSHLSIYRTDASDSGTQIIAGSANVSGRRVILSIGTINVRIGERSTNSSTPAIATNQTGFIGGSRSSSASYTIRGNGSNRTETKTSESPASSNVAIFALPSGANHTPSRLSFYSIGEALDLANLDTRVSTLMTDLDAAI
jgi:hypothetical protein